MKRCLLAWAFLFSGFGMSTLLAAPVTSDKSGGATLIVQIKPIDGLLDLTKQTAQNFLPKEMYEVFEKEVLGQIPWNMLEGIDRKRSLGFYALVDEGVLKFDFSKSQFVALVPVSDESKIKNLLNNFGIKLEEQKEKGLYAVQAPIPIAVPVFARFHKEYAYISIGGSAALEAKSLVEPTAILSAKETAPLAITMNLDRVPTEIKTLLLSTTDEAFQEAQKQAPPEAQEMAQNYFKFNMRRMRMTMDDGKQLVYRLQLDPKSGAFGIDFTLDGKPKSTLAGSISAIKPQPNGFATLVGKDSLAHGYVSLPLYIEDFRDLLISLNTFGVSSFRKDVQRGNTPQAAVDMVETLFSTLEATLKSGQMDGAISFNGPNKEKHYHAVAAVHWKNAKQLEEKVKLAHAVIPQPDQKYFKLDVEKIGEFAVHEIHLPEKIPDEMTKIFGKEPRFAILFGKDTIYMAFGSETTNNLKEAMKAKAGPAPMTQFSVHGKKLATLLKSIMPEGQGEHPGWFSGTLLALENLETVDLFTMNMQGGPQFQMTVRYGLLPFLATFATARSVEVKPNREN